MYYGLHDINNLNNDSSSLGILHTNLASLNKYHDDLEQILSLMKVDFQIIGITEHKIKELTPIFKLAGYHEFIYTPMQTSHGGSGFYIRDSLAFKKRNDLLLNSSGSGDFESTILEIVLPNKKNLIVGCIYFGFRKKHSTNHALIDITEAIRQALDNKVFLSTFKKLLIPSTMTF